MGKEEVAKIVERIDGIVDILSMDKETYINHLEDRFGEKEDGSNLYAKKAGEAEAELIYLSIQLKVHYGLD